MLAERELTERELGRIGVKLWLELTETPGKGDKPCKPGSIWRWDVKPPKPRKDSRVWDRCGRCNGHGSIACFSAQYSGKCFACQGRGLRLIPRATYERCKAAEAAARG